MILIILLTIGMPLSHLFIKSSIIEINYLAIKTIFVTTASGFSKSFVPVQ